MVTGANRIVRMLQDAGVRRLFGMPGGGSNADLIEAATDAGLPFSLAHAETASAFMAAAQAEITGRAGACLATLGPGAASLTNGVANASLDRIPLIIMTDCYSRKIAAVMRHQALHHQEIFRSLVKCSAQLSVANLSEVMQTVLKAISTPPLGPVHLDISQDVASAPIVAGEEEVQSAPCVDSSPAPPIPERVRLILKEARHPVFLIGLGARAPAIASAIRSVCEQFGIPALVTYKAKGVVPDRHPWFGGVFMNGALERNVLEQADLFLAVGLDVVEILPVPWKFSQPVISIAAWPMKQEHIPLLAELVGDVASWVQTVVALLPQKCAWMEDHLLRLVELQRHCLRPETDDGALAPHRVVDLVAEAYPGVRATVDAGAHMLPIMPLWPATEPCGVLISNGLSTMGFAVPAAIGAAFLDRPRPTLAFTGDGGLLMCLGELRTAARENLPLRIIVFDDGELSLIKFKQLRRGYRADGVTIGDVDWRAVGSGLGIRATQADDEKTLRDCLRDTLHHPGPVLISAKVSPRTYQDAIRAVRG
jgi:acetolactate synthase I/II/III large subunit